MLAPKKYPDELRARDVRLYRESEPKPVIQRLAEQLNVHPQALRKWTLRALGLLPERPLVLGGDGVVGVPRHRPALQRVVHRVTRRSTVPDNLHFTLPSSSQRCRPLISATT